MLDDLDEQIHVVQIEHVRRFRGRWQSLHGSSTSKSSCTTSSRLDLFLVCENLGERARDIAGDQGFRQYLSHATPFRLSEQRGGNEPTQEQDRKFRPYRTYFFRQLEPVHVWHR